MTYWILGRFGLSRIRQIGYWRHFFDLQVDGVCECCLILATDGVWNVLNSDMTSLMNPLLEFFSEFMKLQKANRYQRHRDFEEFTDEALAASSHSVTGVLDAALREHQHRHIDVVGCPGQEVQQARRGHQVGHGEVS